MNLFNKEQKESNPIVDKGLPIAKIEPVKVPVSSLEVPKKVETNPVKTAVSSLKNSKKEDVETLKTVAKKMDESANISSESHLYVKPDIKSNTKNIISSADFAAKITNNVNKTVNAKIEEKVVKEETKSNYVTDDQFFDDFFADDDEN